MAIGAGRAKSDSIPTWSSRSISIRSPASSRVCRRPKWQRQSELLLAVPAAAVLDARVVAAPELVVPSGALVDFLQLRVIAGLGAVLPAFAILLVLLWKWSLAHDLIPRDEAARVDARKRRSLQRSGIS